MKDINGFGTDLHVLNSYFSTVRALTPQSEKQFCSNRTSLSQSKKPKSRRVFKIQNYSCYYPGFRKPYSQFLCKVRLM